MFLAMLYLYLFVYKYIRYALFIIYIYIFKYIFKRIKSPPFLFSLKFSKRDWGPTWSIDLNLSLFQTVILKLLLSIFLAEAVATEVW